MLAFQPQNPRLNAQHHVYVSSILNPGISLVSIWYCLVSWSWSWDHGKKIKSQSSCMPPHIAFVHRLLAGTEVKLADAVQVNVTKLCMELSLDILANQDSVCVPLEDIKNMIADSDSTNKKLVTSATSASTRPQDVACSKSKMTRTLRLGLWWFMRKLTSHQCLFHMCLRVRTNRSNHLTKMHASKGCFRTRSKSRGLSISVTMLWEAHCKPSPSTLLGRQTDWTVYLMCFLTMT